MNAVIQNETMRSLRYLIFVGFVLLSNTNADEVTIPVDDIVRILSVEAPDKASKWVLGHEEKTYLDSLFWANLKFRNIIGITTQEVLSKRVLVVSVLYSAADDITIPSLLTRSLFFVLTNNGWRIIPNEFVSSYLREGEKATIAQMAAKIQEEPPETLLLFHETVEKLVVQLHQAEEFNFHFMIEQYNLLKLPLNKLLPSQ